MTARQTSTPRLTVKCSIFLVECRIQDGRAEALREILLLLTGPLKVRPVRPLAAQLLLTFGLIFVAVFVPPVTVLLCGGQANIAEQGGCNAPTDELQTMLITSMVLSFVFLFGIVCCPNQAQKHPNNLCLLFGFTLCEGVMLAVVCLFYRATAVGLAAAMTALVTLGLSLFAAKTTTDFTGMGGYLYAALLTLIVCSFVGSLFGVFYNVPALQSVYAGAGCLVFSCYIVYDTQLIIGGDHRKFKFDPDQYVFAALNIYLDIINLFLYILEIIGSRD